MNPDKMLNGDGRLNPNIKKYKTGSYYKYSWDKEKTSYDYRTNFEKGADILLKKGTGDPVDTSAKYKTNPSKAEDPLIVRTKKYGKFTQDENMIADDVLENQNYEQKGDPEKNFTNINQIPDEEAHNFDDAIDLNDEVSNENKIINNDSSNKKPIEEVLINGVPLGKIMEDKTPIEDSGKGQKISVNRGPSANKMNYHYEKNDNSGKHKHDKTTRRIKNMLNRNAKKRQPTKSFKPWKKIQKEIDKGNDPRILK